MIDNQGRLIVTSDNWKIIENVQTEGNKVVWMSDQQQFGVADKWDFPHEIAGNLRKDCDGIALYKWKLLVQAGIPDACLSMVICKINGEGHAVLCLITDRGDFILDNNFPDVNSWEYLTRQGYVWLMRSTPGQTLDKPWQTLG